MTRISALALIGAVALSAAPAVSFARRHHATSPPGTGSIDSAKSSGKTLGTGQATEPPTTSGDAAINAENEILDRKLKSICRGC